LNSSTQLQQADTGDLKVGQAVERELKGGEGHSYHVPLTSGQYVRVVVEQKGIDVLVKVFGLVVLQKIFGY
jgi:hypothetical protein